MGMQGNTGKRQYRRMHGNTWEYRRIEGNAWKYRGIQENRGECMGIQGNICECRENLGMQENTWEYMEI